MIKRKARSAWLANLFTPLLARKNNGIWIKCVIGLESYCDVMKYNIAQEKGLRVWTSYRVVVRVLRGEGRVSRTGSKEYNAITLHILIKLFMNKVQISGERRESISNKGHCKQSRRGVKNFWETIVCFLNWDEKISLFPHLCIIWMKKKLFVSTSHLKNSWWQNIIIFYWWGRGAGRRREGKVQHFNLITSVQMIYVR